jgi:hypothetical protein
MITILLTFHAFQYVVEKNGKNIQFKRIIELLFLLSISSFTFGLLLPGITFNTAVVKVIRSVLEHNALIPVFESVTVKKGIFYFTGLVLLVNEVNAIIRCVLEYLKMEPFNAGNRNTLIDKGELDRGKIIGVVERVLFYFFVITNNYASIAFILTAKGLTRFKELDDKHFAEYVLIGTLLSSSLSIFCAVFITEIVKVIYK